MNGKNIAFFVLFGGIFADLRLKMKDEILKLTDND